MVRLTDCALSACGHTSRLAFAAKVNVRRLAQNKR